MKKSRAAHTAYMRQWTAANREKKRANDRRSYLRHRAAVRARANAARMKRAALARAYVREARATTLCEKCGAQPVEYHRDTHPQHPHLRINAMVSSGRSVAVIAAEIARCAALCRKCHRLVDFKGRKRAGRSGRWLAVNR